MFNENKLTKKATEPEAYCKSQQEQALLSAVYNTIAISIFFACLGLLIVLFIILQSFIRPIFWAFLTSSFLFSFKRYLTDVARHRLALIDKTGSLIAFELVLFPIRLLDNMIELFWSLLKLNFNRLVILIVTIISLNIISLYYETVMNAAYWFIGLIYQITGLLAYLTDNSYQFTLTLIIGYFLGIIFYWKNGDNKLLFQVLSFPIWINVLFHITRLMGTYRPLFMFIFLLFGCLGIFSLINEFLLNLTKQKADAMLNQSAESASLQDDSLPPHDMSSKYFDESQQLLNDEARDDSFFQKLHSFIKVHNQIGHETSMKRKKEGNSNKYFYLLFLLFLILNLRFDFYIILPVLVVIWRSTKSLSFYINNQLLQKPLIHHYTGLLAEWIRLRSSALMPKPCMFFVNMFVKGDHKINSWFQSSMDSIVSGLMIICLLISFVLFVVVFAIQVHSESYQLVETVFNDNLYQKPQLRDWLPEKEKINALYQATIKNFYLYGREWLLNQLRSSSFVSANSTFGTHNSTNNSDALLQVEIQFLKEFDRLFFYLSRNSSKLLTRLNSINKTEPINSTWINNNSNETKVVSKVKLYNNMKRMVSFANGNDYFDLNKFAFIVKDNIGVLFTIIDSVYLILKGNIQFLSSVLFGIGSLVFTSGFALMNFFFSFIVYITALFYLLSLSDSLHKPFQSLSQIIIMKYEFSIMSLSRSQLLTKAIEESIRSVFLCSIKMALFYGCYTYTIYGAFGLTISASKFNKIIFIQLEIV